MKIKNYVVVVGNIGDGFRIYGPVKTMKKGHNLAAKIVGEDGEWLVMGCRPKPR